jgi:glyoxylase-like metal-dependent hydrolase (beta-lactamase superfamily II)
VTPSPLYRAYAVRYGERHTLYSEVYHHWNAYGEPDGPVTMTFYFWVLQPVDGDGPPIVVDCGFDPDRGGPLGRRCLCRPEEALARLGIDATAVERLILSHLHSDHIGNLDLFPKARITVARAEYDFYTNDPIATRPRFALHANFDAIDLLRQAERDGRLDLVDEPGELAPGIAATLIGGHAPGQLVLEVAGEQGPLVLAADVIHYYDELAHDRAFGIFYDLPGVYRGYDLLRSYAADGVVVVAGHDPLVMERFSPVEGDAAGTAVCVTDPIESQR